MLTEYEKIALHYHVITGFEDWEKLYLMSHPGKNLTKVSAASLISYVSKWKNSQLIKDHIITLQVQKRNEETEKQNQEGKTQTGKESEDRNGSNKKQPDVNFLDRDEFLKFLNDRANEVQDDKLRNDILKMLSDNQRYKDIDKAENQEINRFYTPLTCSDCPLYQEKQKTL